MLFFLLCSVICYFSLFIDVQPADENKEYENRRRSLAHDFSHPPQHINELIEDEDKKDGEELDQMDELDRQFATLSPSKENDADSEDTEQEQ